MKAIVLLAAVAFPLASLLYGRYVLAFTFWESGEKDRTRALIEEIKTKYEDATGHGGQLMTDVAAAAEKQFAAEK